MDQIPNFISILRLLAAPLLVWLIHTHRYDDALWLTVPIGLSDWADGYLARRLQLSSRTGAYLDPAADKVLLVVAFVALGLEGLIPLILVGLVVGRDLVIVGGSALLWRFRGRTKFAPLLAGKVSTAMQIFTVLVVLVSLVFQNGFLAHLRFASFLATAILTLWSGVAYVRKGIRMAARESY